MEYSSDFFDVKAGHIQVGSLAGAAYLLQENAGVLSVSHLGQKPTIANKVKSRIDF